MEAPALSLELPDPERDDISTMEFLSRLEEAWAVCDRFDLQTEIWRGRILRAVRDREKRGGEGRGTGFLQWLREREISKTRAYSRSSSPIPPTTWWVTGFCSRRA